MDYTELHCLSSFSFLRGASAPDELAATAVAQQYRGLALTDACSLAGVVRAWDEAKKHPNFRFIVGSELQLTDGPRLVLLVEDLRGYQTLSQLITRARRDTPKGHYRLAAARPAGVVGAGTRPEPRHRRLAARAVRPRAPRPGASS